jgi:sulfate adenylyltransferase subunit 1
MNESHTIPAAQILRVITAGSVDDGKSTLIGRLLYDSKAILVDQLEAIGKSRFQRTTDGSIDLSLLTEREQGITIDVAYRYFNTAKRKFILADAPGHEQYTRNMVTGASSADAVIVLIDATRVINGQLLPQTKRHSAIAKLLDVKHLIVAVNKMDLIAYDQAKFEVIATAYRALAQSLNLQAPHIIPISALTGDNVTRASNNMPWHSGKTLLDLLEALPATESTFSKFRFPVQWIIRAEGNTSDDFRGIAGRIATGEISVGDFIKVAGTTQSGQVREIRIGDEKLSRAAAGQSVTLVLDHDVDISRGDTLVCAAETAEARSDFSADLCWLDTQAFNPNRKYWLKHGTRTTYAKITAVESVLDVNTLSHASASENQSSLGLTLNAIGRVRLTAQNPLIADSFAESKITGAFVLIDPASHQTAAAGMIRPSA